MNAYASLPAVPRAHSRRIQRNQNATPAAEQQSAFVKPLQPPKRVDSLLSMKEMQHMAQRPQQTPLKTGVTGFQPTPMWLPASMHASDASSGTSSICASPMSPLFDPSPLRAQSLEWMATPSVEAMTVPLKRVDTLVPPVRPPAPAPIVPENAEEQKCLERAKALLRQCILESSRLNQYRLMVLLGFGSFGVVVQAQAPGMEDDVIFFIMYVPADLQVAIKIMRKAQIHASRNCFDPHNGQQTTLEVALLKHAPRHRNIVGYVDSWEDQECWYLVTDLGGYPWDRDTLDGQNLQAMDDSSTLATSFERMAVATGNSRQPYQRLLIPKRGNNHSLAGFMRACGAWSDQAPTCANREPVLKEPIQKRIIKQLVDAVRVLHQHGIVHRDLKDEVCLLVVYCLNADIRMFYWTPTCVRA
jgi:hypothetical protein